MSVSDRAAAERVIEEARTICAVPAPTFAEGPRGELVADLLTAAGVAPRRDGVGNVIAHLARRLRGSALRRPVVLAATVGEEGHGDLRGAKALVDDGPCGAFVAVEGMMLDGLTVAAVGSVRFRLTVRGPGGDPWGDPGSPSAIHGILRPLQAIIDEPTAAGVVVNVGVLTGGTVINAIAGAASAELDVRSEDDDALRRATETVRKVFAELGPGLTADIEPLGHRPGGRLDPGHELLAAARSARRQAGLPEASEGASSTDANAAHGRGIPAITVGVSTRANPHRLDEYIDLEPIPAGLASLEALFDELAGAS